MIYMQETGKLTDLITAVKNRNEITNENNVAVQTDVELFEKTLGNNIETIEKQFDEWRAKNYQVKPVESSHQSSEDDGGQHMMQETRMPVFNTQQNVQQQKAPDNSGQQMMQQEKMNVQNNAPANAVSEYNANDALNELSLHVEKDADDKLGNGIAFKYSLKGDSKVLDNIEEVYYQRNHDSFQEYNKSFYKSSDRANNFLFKGYQWGSIETVKVYVVMKDNTKSDVILKSIIYDN